ncbi:esterase-like activity of phytase family protein [Mycobacterium sp. ITM-2016-00317]|uniref:esterase-like activity of phytase family protein n=1 Tax=Mycobacterium sp. ITM-2016-00317 TaxID=2099694 RepID=UPI00287FDCF9|nr:esterase-like activity of phytase family protein [Mycobacterium sp. ITM-2016-00317]WNG86457.1 esterase-like activity of phytase family protein [Mycobacterium sp. ITM-2016-00317]
MQFLGQKTLPHGTTFDGTVVGGLSAITYDPDRRLYYVICDDRSVRGSARFYTVRIALSLSGIRDVSIVDVQPLLHTSVIAPDPEGIAFDVARQQLYWSSEGFVPLDPWIRIAGLDGSYRGEFRLPAHLRLSRDQRRGARPNGSLEGLTLSPDGRFLYAAMEEPRWEDGEPAHAGGGALIRIAKFDVERRKGLAQCGYQVEAAPPGTEGNGVSDILALSDEVLLVMERAGSRGLKLQVRLFRAELTGATDISPIPKRLVADLAAIPALGTPDNVEGLTLGPVLPDGRQSLVLVSDDNFSDRQISQFLAFAL